MSTAHRSFGKLAALLAMIVGIAAGSYGVASAATGSSTTTNAAPPAQSAPAQPWGMQRSDETPLTGDALAQVKAAAVAKLGSDATIVRVETDADGNAAYEAHAVEADGTLVTVYLDKSYSVVGVESR